MVFLFYTRKEINIFLFSSTQQYSNVSSLALFRFRQSSKCCVATYHLPALNRYLTTSYINGWATVFNELNLFYFRIKRFAIHLIKGGWSVRIVRRVGSQPSSLNFGHQQWERKREMRTIKSGLRLAFSILQRSSHPPSSSRALRRKHCYPECCSLHKLTK